MRKPDLAINVSFRPNKDCTGYELRLQPNDEKTEALSLNIDNDSLCFIFEAVLIARRKL